MVVKTRSARVRRNSSFRRGVRKTTFSQQKPEKKNIFDAYKTILTYSLSNVFSRRRARRVGSRLFAKASRALVSSFLPDTTFPRQLVLLYEINANRTSPRIAIMASLCSARGMCNAVGVFNETKRSYLTERPITAKIIVERAPPGVRFSQTLVQRRRKNALEKSFTVFDLGAP